MKQVQQLPDILVENHGSLITFTMQNESARAWINANVESEPYQWFGDALCVEPRYAADVVNAMISEGFLVI